MSYSDASDDGELDRLAPAAAIGFYLPDNYLVNGLGNSTVRDRREAALREMTLLDAALREARDAMFRQSSFPIGPSGDVMMPNVQDSDDDDDEDQLVRILERVDSTQNGVIGEADVAEMQDMSEGPLPAVTSWRALREAEDIEGHLDFLVMMDVNSAVIRRIDRVDEVTLVGEAGRQIRFFDSDGLLIVSLRVYAPGD